jgi:GTPase KRas protein
VTSANEDYAALREIWISAGDGFLIVYDVTSRESFIRAQYWFDTIQQVKAKQTIPEANRTRQRHRYPGTQPDNRPFLDMGEVPAILLVGNKDDRYMYREVRYEEGETLARSLGLGFIETSAKSGNNIDETFFELVREIRRERRRLIMEAVDQDQKDPTVLGTKDLDSLRSLLSDKSLLGG